MKLRNFAVAVLLAGGFALAGCSGSEATDPCQVNPTKTAADGRWVEADGEPLDDDPCDADDAWETDTHKKKPVRKPGQKTKH